MKRIFLLALVWLCVNTLSFAQVDPNDPIVVYDENNPPSTAGSNNNIIKWVITPQVSWNSNKWKAYYHKTLAFRLRFPNNYDPNRAEKYPLIVILHGRGFKNGTIYMNDRHLNNSGAKAYEDGINKNKFDGFVLSPQSVDGWFSEGHMAVINSFIQIAATQVNFDLNRVSLNGRSAGAQAVWKFIQNYPKTYASALPMAGVTGASTDNIDRYKHIPLWVFQGELDASPTTFTTENAIAQVIAKNGFVRYSLYKEAGHGIFDRGYAEPDYFDFMDEVHKANPSVMSGQYAQVYDDSKKQRYEFLTNEEKCPGDPINLRLGLTAGFDGYEWRKDGNIIAGATGNEIVVDEFGTYSARIKRGNTWSEWSPKPVVVKLKDPTVTPDIQVEGVASNVLPAPDGSTNVNLELPQGFADYEWQRVGENGVLSSQRVYTASQPGAYVAKVRENFGCSSSFSNEFQIIDANGPNPPLTPLGFNGFASSKTSVELLWTTNPNDNFKATKFEIYRSLEESTGYEYLGSVDGDTFSYTDEGLLPDQNYYYQIRAVNATAASDPTPVLPVKTLVDQISPTAPDNLAVTGSNSFSVSLNWEPSTDDVGVYRYDIYRDGIKTLSVEGTSATVFNLQANRIYTFNVVARDITGNESALSNRAVAVTTVNNDALHNLKFNGSYADASGNNVNSNVNGNFTFDTNNPPEGNSAVSFAGVNSLIDLDVGNQFIHTACTERTVAFWMKIDAFPNGVEDIFDEGGSVNGIAARLNNNTLEFAIRDDRRQRTLSSAVQSGAWQHVAMVYDKGIQRLYIDGVLADENLNVGFSEISDHSDSGGLGGTNGSNAFDQSSGYFNGSLDDYYVFGTALTPAEINQLLNPEEVATIPVEDINPPTEVTASAVSFNQIDVTWVDNINNEVGFQVYRAEGAGKEMPIAILPANSNTYVDYDVKPETKYAYSIKVLTEYNEAKSANATNINALAHLPLNNSLVDASGNNVNSPVSGTTQFNNTDATEGTHSFAFNGSTYINIDQGNQFIHNAFQQRSIAFWIKADNTPGIQDIYDEGGSTNGIGIRLIDGDIQLTVQNRHDIQSVSAPMSRNEWNHVTGIFDKGELRLYLNGSLVASRTGINYSTVDDHGNNGGIGGTNSSNAFDQVSARFTGLIDDVYLFGRAVDDEIEAIMASVNPENVAVTLPLPPVPAAPASIVTTNVGFNDATFSFTVKSDNEDFLVVSRAINTSSSFQVIDTLNQEAMNTSVSYTDDGLDANITYYYKVAAVNAGGSGESDVLEVKTLNTVPELEGGFDLNMRFGETYDLQLSASDADGDNLVYSVQNLPSFGSLTDYGDGSGLIQFKPTESDSGTYNNIQVSVSDPFGGVASQSFTLEVNDNFSPTLSNVDNLQLLEGDTVEVNVQASDQNGTEELNWTVSKPDFVTFNNLPDGSATLVVESYYTDAGVYEVNLVVNDPLGARAEESFLITVDDVNPNRFVQINFTNGNLSGGTGWNNTNGAPTQGDTYSNLIDTRGNASGMSLTLESAMNNTGANELGSTTNNNSGVYPDNVIKSSYWTGSSTQTMSLNGLNDNTRYDFTFFGSREATNDRSTRYIINGQSRVLDAAGNSTNTVAIEGVTPVNGSITFSFERANGSTYGYINALVVEEAFSSNQPPAAPDNVFASYSLLEGQVNLTWNDRAFDESGYEVFKSVDGQPFTSIATINSIDVESFSDNDVITGQEVIYKVVAFNTNGSSEEVSSQAIVIPKAAPSISVAGPAVLAGDESGVAQVTAVASDNSVITFSFEGLPSFATTNEVSNGELEILLSPGVQNVGVYPITVIAEDADGLKASELYTVTVTASGQHSYYVNFTGSSSNAAPAPWNNYIGNGNAGSSLTEISSDIVGFNELGLELLDSWGGTNDFGMTNSDIYPAQVTSTSLWVGNTNTKRIVVSGLSQEYAYDFTFFASRNGAGDRTATYSIGNKSVSLNAAYNSNETVTIEGVSPQSNGEIVIVIQKTSAASYGYINSLVIDGYSEQSIPTVPTNLVGFPLNSSEIQLEWEDNTSQESGYEVWRKRGETGTFNLVSTLGANTISYTDINLDRGVTYFYKVRAVLGEDDFSDYSNTIGTSTVNMTLSINFNVEDPEGFPWNNTNQVPDPGLVFGNLTDELGNNTGISFEILTSNPEIDPSFYGFSGDNPFGMNTGNNSGVVPDNVMRSTWWMDPNKTAELRFYGLDLSQKYNFSFFASRDGGGDRTTVYTVDDKSASLNASFNTSQLVKVNDIKPDQNGEAIVSVTTAPGAMFSYLGAIIIESANDVSGTNSRLINPKAPDTVINSSLKDLAINVYPNPLSTGNDLHLQLEGKGFEGELELTIFEVSGSVRINRTFRLDEIGQRIIIPEEEINLGRGMYLMRVVSSDQFSRTFKLLFH